MYTPSIPLSRCTFIPGSTWGIPTRLKCKCTPSIPLSRCTLSLVQLGISPLDLSVHPLSHFPDVPLSLVQPGIFYGHFDPVRYSCTERGRDHPRTFVYSSVYYKKSTDQGARKTRSSEQASSKVRIKRSRAYF